MTRLLRAPALPASLDEVQDLLEELWQHAGDVIPTDRLRFSSAVVEIAANIIEHAVPTAGLATVTLSLEVACDDTALRAVFDDDGQFADVDLNHVGMPDDLAEGGRGLALATAASDVLTYVRTGSVNRWVVECARTESVVAQAVQD